MKKVLLTGAYKWTEEKMQKVHDLGFETEFIQDERVPLEIDASEFDAVVCNGLFLYNPIEKFKKLKFIQATSAGLDRIPLDYVKENEIKLFNARGVYSAPMAEWAVMRVLEIYKKSTKFYESQKSQKWEKQRELLEISGKTVCVVGTGSVGLEVAKRFYAFDATIIGVDIFQNESEYFERYVHINDIDTVLGECDIIVLTLPLTNETKGLFNKDKFDKMKENSVIINIARGPIIEESAMIEALNSGKLLGAGLDVFDSEPLNEDSPFWKMENVLISPHNSFVSDRTADRLFDVIYNNLKTFAEEK